MLYHVVQGDTNTAGQYEGDGGTIPHEETVPLGGLKIQIQRGFWSKIFRKEYWSKKK